MSEGSDRISLSRETLRAELSQLELRLVDRLTNALELKADNSTVAEMQKQIASLENSRSAREHLAHDMMDLERRVGGLEKFRYAWPSLALLGVIAMFLTVAYYFVGGHP